MSDYNKPTDRIRRILVKECKLYSPPSNFGFTGICPCGGRVTCNFTGKKPNRKGISTCKSCGRCNVGTERG